MIVQLEKYFWKQRQASRKANLEDILGLLSFYKRNWGQEEEILHYLKTMQVIWIQDKAASLIISSLDIIFFNKCRVSIM